MDNNAPDIFSKYVLPILSGLFSGGVISTFISFWINKQAEKSRRTFDVRSQLYNETLDLIQSVSKQQEQYSQNSLDGIKPLVAGIFNGVDKKKAVEDYFNDHVVPQIAKLSELQNTLNNNFAKLKIYCSQELYAAINEYIATIKQVVARTPEWMRKLAFGDILPEEINGDEIIINTKRLSELIPALMRQDMRKYLKK